MTHRPPRGVPRDEWLLAVRLACREPGRWIFWADVTTALPFGWGDEFDAARSGCLDVRQSNGMSAGDCGSPDAYAAGAALAMALEAK